MTKLYEARDHVLIRTGYDDPIRHRHMAAHIIISLESNLHISSDDHKGYHCQGILIPSGLSHEIHTTGPALVFLFDCTSGTARQIHQLRPISEQACRRILSRFQAFEEEEISYQSFLSFLLGELSITDSGNSITDERVLRAMDYIRSKYPEKVTCREVAARVCLSPDRFSHLFRQQVGMTFAAYLLYQRTMAVYAAVLRGMPVTTAALNAGFSSSSHFADVHRRLFGLPVRVFKKNLVFSKVG